MSADGIVTAVAADGEHHFGKPPREWIELLAGLGVAGDAHAGATVQHLSRLGRTPEAPNLRQVHLIQAELFEELRRAGFAVTPGALGENVTTAAIDLIALPRGTTLRLGRAALVELTGLRNPCRQIDENIGFGAMAAVLEHAADGSLIRKAGVMAVVLKPGEVRAGDSVRIERRPRDGPPLEPV